MLSLRQVLGKKDNQIKEACWRPSYLRRSVLFLFIFAFSAVIAALEILYKLSQKYNGIAASSENRHYLWTYGPTTILTILGTFWSRVDFQSKQNAPWQSMAEDPQPPEKSVLLDYISEMQPVAMWKAFRNKHLIVFSSVSCSLLLQLIIVFSTGLFSLEEAKAREKAVPIQLHDHFSTENLTLHTVGSQPYDIVNGLAFENLSYPLGTTGDLTFQDFSAHNLPSDAVISVPVNGLMANLSCEAAEIDVRDLKWQESVNADTGSVRSSTIVQHLRLITPSCTVDTVNEMTIGYVELVQTAMFQWGRCENTTGPDGTRIGLTLIDVHRTNNDVKNGTDHAHRENPIDLDVPLTLNRSISYICKPTLSRVQLQAEKNATDPGPNVRLRQIGIEDANFPDLSAQDLAAFIRDNISDTSGFRSIEYFRPFPGNVYVDDQIRLGIALSKYNPTLETLWQENVLKNSITAYYRAVTAQLMHMGLKHEQETVTNGTALLNEKRVLMMQLPLRVIEACLIVVILLTSSMIWVISQKDAAVWNSAHISTIAAVTANSEDFRQFLQGTGTTSSSRLQKHLGVGKFSTQSNDKGPYIQVWGNSPEYSQIKETPRNRTRRWKPFPNLFVRVGIFVLICSAIVTLEVLLHLSQANEGLGDATPTDEYIHYLWTVIPAGIMTGFSLFFSSIDFNIRCLAPYAHLRRTSGAAFEESLSLSFLDSHGISNSLCSVKMGHLAVLATTLATGAAWFLAIIVSGLFAATEIPSHLSMNFSRIGGFPDPRTIAGALLDTEESQEVAGILKSEYILLYNFSFPSWSYDELAFAEIAIEDPANFTFANGSYVDIVVPALRSAPACTIMTEADLKPNLTRSVYGEDVSYQLTAIYGNLACPGGNTSYIAPSTIFSVKNIPDGSFGYSIEDGCYSLKEDGKTGASHYTEAYFWGHLKSGSVKFIMGLNCIQFAETVDVKTRFKLPGMDIDEEHPPVPDESTAKLAPNVYTPIPEWWALNTNGQYPTLNGFFYLLTSGKYAIGIENLMDPMKNETVIRAIKHQHKLINAQQFNNYTRITSNDTIKHAPLHGNITTTNRIRLTQDPTSTRILEALLGAMLILGVIGTVILNTDHVLPKNPCSIASVASLVADSSLLDQFKQGLWNPNDHALGATFAERRFYLGWWECEEDKLFTIDHVQAEKKP